MTNARWKKPLFATVMLLGVAVFCEATLHVVSWVSPRVDGLLAPEWHEKPVVAQAKSNSPLFIEDNILRYRGNPSHPDHDNAGFRNASIPQTATIVALGDSQTYGVNADRADAWPQQLMRDAGVSTYNMGFGGWGPAQCLALLPEALKRKPELLVVAVYAGNDLFDCYDFVHVRGQLPHLMQDDSALTARLQDMQAEQTLRDEVQAAWPYRDQLPQAPVVKSTSKDGPGFARRLVSDHCKLYGLARALRQACRPKPAVARSTEATWNRYKAAADVRPDLCMAIETDTIRTVCRPTYRLIALDDQDPRIVEGRRIALASLGEIERQAREAGVRVLVALIPTKEYALAGIVPEEQWRLREAHDRLIASEDTFWSETRAYLDEQGVPWVDTLPALRDALRNGPQPYSPTLDDHPNGDGYHAIATAVWEAIEGRGLLE